MNRKEQEKDRKKATENELKKWVNIMVKKNHSKNRQNLVKMTWVSLNLLPK